MTLAELYQKWLGLTQEQRTFVHVVLSSTNVAYGDVIALVDEWTAEIEAKSELPLEELERGVEDGSSE